MVTDDKLIGYGLSDPGPLITSRHNPHGNPEIPAANPARIVGKLEFPNTYLSIPHGDIAHLTRKQRPLPGPFLNNILVEFFTRPVVCGAVRWEITV